MSRFALSICAVVVMLAGCGGSQPPLATTGGMPIGRASSGYGYTTLYSFGMPYDGQQPKAGLIDVNGTLYGTTYKGGKYGAGTVFSMSTTGSETVLHSFNTYSKHNDGANPSASLIAVKGLLYGTTEYGGSEAPFGTVFKISTTGTEKVLYRFRGYYDYRFYYDGANPVASLIYVKGKLYGTTYSGGDGQYFGTIFRVSMNGKEKVLHIFSDYSTDGVHPAANLIDVKGTLYGTTVNGGAYYFYKGWGTVFSVSTNGTENVIHDFYPGYAYDGGVPQAGLINANGALYGTTGGSGVYGGGTAFRVSTSGNLTTLHSFGSGSDGSHSFAPLLRVRGTFYGTTSAGGAYGKGTVFSMSLGGSEKILHSFGYGSDGATPLAGLIDVNGTLYGTTSAGGTYGDGTVFALKLGSK